MNGRVSLLHEKQLSRLLEAARGVLAKWSDTEAYAKGPGSPFAKGDAESELQWALRALATIYDDCRATMVAQRAPAPPEAPRCAVCRQQL